MGGKKEEREVRKFDLCINTQHLLPSKEGPSTATSPPGSHRQIEAKEASTKEEKQSHRICRIRNEAQGSQAAGSEGLLPRGRGWRVGRGICWGGWEGAFWVWEMFSLFIFSPDF